MEATEVLQDILEVILTIRGQPFILATKLSFMIKENAMSKAIKVVSIHHNIIDVLTMVIISFALCVNYVTRLAIVPKYVAHIHNHNSHLKLITWLVI